MAMPRPYPKSLVGTCILIFWIFLQLGATLPEPVQLDRGLARITTPQGSIIYAEIADTPEKMARGLMFLTSLAPDRGMLFTFQGKGRWTFWMKNTKISLDIIWLDQEGKIVHINHNTPTCERIDDFCPRYTPHEPAIWVLEVRGGQAKKLRLQTGSRLKVELP